MIAKGARPQTSPLPLTREVDMNNPFSFAAFPSWKRVFADTAKEAQKKVYADPAFRNQFRQDLKNPTGFSNWGRIGVYAIKNPALKHLEGKSIATIAQEQGKDGVDAFLDLVLADNLQCELTMASWNTREDRMKELLNNKSILMALGDGGAHVDMLCDAGYPTYLLGTWVREKQAITLGGGCAQAHLRSRRSLRLEGSRPAWPRVRRRTSRSSIPTASGRRTMANAATTFPAAPSAS